MGRTGSKCARATPSSGTATSSTWRWSCAIRLAAAYAYFQLTHDGKPETNTTTVAETFGAQSFIGFAVYTDERKFEKIHLSDLDKGKADYVKQATNGWLAFGAFRLGVAARKACSATTQRKSVAFTPPGRWCR